jgi:hypothetical protein
MHDRITANYPIDQAAIRDLYRKLLDDQGTGARRLRGSRLAWGDAGHRRRTPDKRALSNAPRDRVVDRNTHPIRLRRTKSATVRRLGRKV